jgi:hypothetical protein
MKVECPIVTLSKWGTFLPYTFPLSPVMHHIAPHMNNCFNVALEVASIKPTQIYTAKYSGFRHTGKDFRTKNVLLLWNISEST